MEQKERNYTLKNARQRKNYSQEEMARELKISLTSYTNKENRKGEFKESEMIALSKILKTSLDDLFREV